MTRIVDPLSSTQLGHVTFAISLLTSLRNFFEESNIFAILCIRSFENLYMPPDLTIPGKIR